MAGFRSVYYDFHLKAVEQVGSFFPLPMIVGALTPDIASLLTFVALCAIIETVLALIASLLALIASLLTLVASVCALLLKGCRKVTQ